MFNKRIVKAFTLLELIVVIVVLGILAMLAVPTFNTVKEKSADSVANKNASAVQRDYNAQAALAASDSSITPLASGAWTINGTSYCYTATAGNTGQNVVASKTNGCSGGGNGGGGQGSGITYNLGTDFTTFEFYAGNAGSASTATKTAILIDMSNATLSSSILGMSNINMVLTDGTNTATWIANPRDDFGQLYFDTDINSVMWSQWNNFFTFSVAIGSITVNTSTNTVTFNVAS